MDKPCLLAKVSKGSRYPTKYLADGTNVQISRLIYCAAHGLSLSEIDGLVIRHRCDTPACIEATHLELGTQKQNMQDASDRNRLSKHGVNNGGSGNGRAKLTPEDVSYIRAVCVKGHPELGVSALARKFGVYPSAVSSIVRGVSWRTG